MVRPPCKRRVLRLSRSTLVWGYRRWGKPEFFQPLDRRCGHGHILNKFPYEPSSTPNFSNYEPLSVSVYDPKISVPAVQNFNLTIQRQLSDRTIFSLGYVGSIGRHEVLTSEINPGINPAGCAASPACVASDDLPTLFPGNYEYPGNVFGSVGQVETVGISNYNSVQTSLERHFSHGLQFLVAYVYSKSMDDSSGFENSGFQGGGFGGFGETRSVNPFNRHVADYGPSIFDAQQRLVISYVYTLPSVRTLIRSIYLTQPAYRWLADYRDHYFPIRLSLGRG